VLGQASGAATDHLLPKAMLVRVARPRRGREGVQKLATAIVEQHSVAAGVQEGVSFLLVSLIVTFLLG